jgi:hypothetical protein
VKTLPRHEPSLFGGPLHRAARRAGLVRGGDNTFPIGVVLGVVPWVVGVLLSAAEGGLAGLFSVEVIGGHVRMLVAIPLFFACEAVLGPQLDRFTQYCVRSGLLSGAARIDLEAQLARTRRLKDAWMPEAACLAAAILMALTTPVAPWGGVTSGLTAQVTGSLAGWWYSVVCLTLFRFLLFRWIWRFALWCHLLWRLSRMDLRLMAAHADRSAGLGMLGEVQMHFLPLLVALSAVLSASFAEDVASGRVPFEAIYPAFVALPLAAVLLVAMPLAVFAPRLLACRQQGLCDYLALAARYATDFDGKWLGRAKPPGEPLLGSGDIQSLADLSTTIDIVRGMRVIPMGPRVLTWVVVAVLLPMLPLLTLEYPISTMLEQLVDRLIGL